MLRVIQAKRPEIGLVIIFASVGIGRDPGYSTQRGAVHAHAGLLSVTGHESAEL